MSRQAPLVLALLCCGTAFAGEAGKVIFATGSAQVASQATAVGAAVNEGDLLQTGRDGFIYVKTADNGLLILRPNTQARIVTYHIDRTEPKNTRVKLELISGVARSKSGEAVKLARQNFRFNTPVAAIGVRGTDFTVSTDQEMTRVAVLSGGVVVSGFQGACRPEGSGPCEGGMSRELFAAQRGQLLQVKRGKAAPEMMQGGGVTPDDVAPPRGDEPSAKVGGSNSAIPMGPSLDAHKTDSLNQSANLGVPPGDTSVDPTVEQPPVPVVPPTPPVVVEEPRPPVLPERAVVWGRWQRLLERPATIDVTASRKNNELLAMNGNYALLRTPGKDYIVPERGNIAFRLKDSEAFIYTAYGSSTLTTAASLSNGKLDVDFGSRTFTTSADLTSRSVVYPLQAQGVIAGDGRLSSEANGKIGVMNIQGLLTNDRNTPAAYIFDSKLDERRTANGVMTWRQ